MHQTDSLESTIRKELLRIGPMKEIRPEVQEVMRSCERLLALLTDGGLSAIECDVLHYYSQELDQLGPICPKPQQNSTSSSCASST